MKKLIALALAFAMILTCSLALADRLADIQAAGKIVIATSPDWPPYEYIDDDGNIVGTDVLMMHWIADQLGVELEIQPLAFDACLAAVLRAGEQLMELVNSLLSPADGPKAADYDLRDLADGVETLLRAYAGADRTVTVTVQDSAPRRLNGDAGAIRQILLNLGGNAVKYAAPGPVEITLSVDDAEDGLAQHVVADDEVGNQVEGPDGEGQLRQQLQDQKQRRRDDDAPQDLLLFLVESFH